MRKTSDRIKVLHVCSSKQGKPNTIVNNQVMSLNKFGVENKFYLIYKKGISGYIYHYFNLATYLNQNEINLIHSHYSLCGFISALATRKPMIASLMGSDGKRSLLRPILQFFNRYFWDVTILKSKDLLSKTKLKHGVQIIPNGVDLSTFPEINRKKARELVNFKSGKKHIVFIADPSRPEKNVTRARNAILKLNRNDVQFHIIHGISHTKVNHYLQAADLLLLTSNYEGSPNIIKEAMAANCPIVTTPVGDVEYLLDDLPGTYVSSFDPRDIAVDIEKALRFGKRTTGREQILKLGLGSDVIANKIISLYNKVLSEKSKP